MDNHDEFTRKKFLMSLLQWSHRTLSTSGLTAWKAELHTSWGPELWSQADLGLNPALSPTDRTSFLGCVVETQQDNACKTTSPGEGNKHSINGDCFQ